MRYLVVLLALCLEGQEIPKVQEIDQLRTQNKIQELMIKDFQLRLNQTQIQATELQLQLLRKDNANFQQDLQDSLTFYNSYIVALVTRYKLDPAAWTYDNNKKEFVKKPDK